MTATAAAAEHLRTRGSTDEHDEQVHDDGPDRRAPEKTYGETDVEMRPLPAGNRVHNVTVLSSLVVVQLAWMAALTYGVYSLLR